MVSNAHPGLYAASDIDITFLERSKVLPITIIARISLKPDNKMTGLKFFTGPFVFIRLW